MLPIELIKLIEKSGISSTIIEKIWSDGTDFLKQGTIEYDINLILKTIAIDRQSQMNNFIDKVISIESNDSLIKYLIDISKKSFEINSVIKGSKYINENIIDKIGINSRMCCQNGNHLTYAACHHCYNHDLIIPGNYIVYSPCTRNENYYDKFRKMKFDMFEIVSFGNEAQLEKNKWEFIYYMKLILDKNRIADYKVVVANDSFITNETNLLLYQILSRSKIEILVYSKQQEKYIAVSSINMHRRNFVNTFKLTDDLSVNSMCFGIGVDRLLELLIENNSI